jgi:hypothetical protein
MKPVGRPSLSINVRLPRGVGFLGSGASESFSSAITALGALRVTTISRISLEFLDFSYGAYAFHPDARGAR